MVVAGLGHGRVFGLDEEQEPGRFDDTTDSGMHQFVL